MSPEYFNTFFGADDLRNLTVYDDTILNHDEKSQAKNDCFIYYHLIDEDKEIALEYAKLLEGYDGDQGYNSINSIIKFPGWVGKPRLLNMINGLNFLNHCETNQWLFREAITVLRNRFIDTIKWRYDYPYCWLHHFRTVFTYNDIHKFYPDSIAIVYPEIKAKEHLEAISMEIPDNDFLDYVAYYHPSPKIIKVWKLTQGYLVLNCDDLRNDLG